MSFRYRTASLLRRLADHIAGPQFVVHVQIDDYPCFKDAIDKAKQDVLDQVAGAV